MTAERHPLSRLGAVAREVLLELVAPARCAACDERIAPATLFCPVCADAVEAFDDDDDDDHEDIAPFVYGGAVARAITRFKYADRPDLARPLVACLLRARPRMEAFAPDVVVPVPLHPVRLAERGYNQAGLLASGVARALDVRCSPRALVRRRPTPKQAALDRASRLANLCGAFAPAVVAGAALAGKRVLLVDDVRTTGATLAACEDTVLAAGAEAVVSAVVAFARE